MGTSAAALVLLGLVVSGASPEGTQVPRALGWTADSAFFAYEVVETDYHAEGEGEGVEYAPERMKLAVVVNADTGARTEYLLAHERYGKAPTALMGRGSALPNKQAFEAWLKQHPLKPGSGPSSPDGKRKASIRIEVVEEGDYPQEVTKEDGAYKLSVLSSGQVIRLVVDDRSVRTLRQQGVGMFDAQGSVRAYWSPDQKRVAWIVQRDDLQWMRGPIPGDASVVVTDAVGLRVSVVAPEVALDQVKAKVVPALKEAGFAPTNVAAALKARAQTVVYARKRRREDAKRIAEVVPGGATVEDLTWKTDMDIVVAVGDSALKAP